MPDGIIFGGRPRGSVLNTRKQTFFAGCLTMTSEQKKSKHLEKIFTAELALLSITAFIAL